MNPQNKLFHTALCLQDPWIVARTQLCDTPDGEPGGGGGDFRSLQIDIDFKRGARFACPECGVSCPVHDTAIKNWRHLDFWQYRTFLSARVPRLKCPEHGVLQVRELPWARPGSGFTLLFEAFLMSLVQVMPVLAAARIVGEHDTRVWRVVRHHVDAAHAKQDWSNVVDLAVDETSVRKRHSYATAFVDLTNLHKEGARLLHMHEGKSGETLGEFKKQMPGHGADPSAIENIAMDMSPAFKKGVADHFDWVNIVYDRWHVMKLAGGAVDTLRRELQKTPGPEGAILKGSLWALRGNACNLSAKQLEVRDNICRRHKKIARALALREELQRTWEFRAAWAARRHLNQWLGWARRCRLAPFVALSRTINNHLEGILNFYPNSITSAAIESINNIIQTARRRARGYRNFDNLRAIAYWMAGKLDLPIRAHSN